MFQSKLFQQTREFPSNPTSESLRSSGTLFLPSEIKLCNPHQPLHLMICLTSCVMPKLIPRRKTTSKGTYSFTLGLCFPPFFSLSRSVELVRYTDMIKKELNLCSFLCTWSFFVFFKDLPCVWVGVQTVWNPVSSTTHIQCTYLSNETITLGTSPDLPPVSSLTFTFS